MPWNSINFLKLAALSICPAMTHNYAFKIIYSLLLIITPQRYCWNTYPIKVCSKYFNTFATSLPFGNGINFLSSLLNISFSP